MPHVAPAAALGAAVVDGGVMVSSVQTRDERFVDVLQHLATLKKADGCLSCSTMQLEPPPLSS
jgi:hypothetical protein